MKFDFSDIQQKLYDDILYFSKENLNVNIIERTQNQVFDRNLWEMASEKGLSGLCIEKDYGGSGYSPLDTVIALEALGEGCEDGGLNFAICAHLFACLVPIQKYASQQLKQDFLPKLCNGVWIGANAMTESSAGSDVFDMETIAILKDNTFLLNGAKTYVTNAPVADVFLTYAQTDRDKGYLGGISTFIIDRKIHKPEVIRTASKLGLRTCTMGSIKMFDLLVDKSYLVSLQGSGAQIFHYSMNFERICLGAIHLGTMKRMLSHVLLYLQSRKSGGLSIDKHQAVSHKIAEMYTRLQAARALTYNAAKNLGKKNKKSDLDGAVVKLFVSETFKKFSLELVQLFGGAGYRDDHEAGRILTDAIGSTIYSGTSEVQKNIIAGWLKHKI